MEFAANLVIMRLSYMQLSRNTAPECDPNQHKFLTLNSSMPSRAAMKWR